VDKVRRILLLTRPLLDGTSTERPEVGGLLSVKAKTIMTKRIIFLILLILVAGLSACGSNAATPSGLEPDSGNSAHVETPIQSNDSTSETDNESGPSDNAPPLSTETLIETNPIDIYFREKDHLLAPAYTHDIAHFIDISASAWFAEMENSYELLRNSTNSELVRKLIDKEENSYINYIKSSAEVEVMLGFSSAFDDDSEHLYVGSGRLIFQTSFQEDGWRTKTIELFTRLDSIGITPQFIFDAEKYDEVLRQAFPERWNEVFDNESHDELYFEFEIDIGDGVSSFFVTIHSLENESHSESPLTISVYIANDRVSAHQTIETNTLGSLFHSVIVDDFNFDGYNDFSVLRSRGNANYFRDFWLWDNSAQKFAFNEDLSKISMPTFDSETKIVSGYERHNAAEFTATHYKYIDNILVCIRILEQSYQSNDNSLLLFVLDYQNGELVEAFRSKHDLDNIGDSELYDAFNKWNDLSEHPLNASMSLETSVTPSQLIWDNDYPISSDKAVSIVTDVKTQMMLAKDLDPDKIGISWWREDCTWIINDKYYYIFTARYYGNDDVAPVIGIFAVDAYTGALYEKHVVVGPTKLVYCVN